MKKFCMNCGKEIPENSNFCTACGTAADGSGRPATFPASEAPAAVPAAVAPSSPSAGSRVAASARTISGAPDADETVIPKSKRKLVGGFLGCLMFVVLFFCVMALDPDGNDWRTSAAPLGVLFFGVGAIAFPCMMFRKKPGMVLNAHGFEFLAAARSTGFVRWPDVAGFQVECIALQTMLVVQLKDPDAYCRAHGGLSRANMNMCGSPVCIPKASALAMDFYALVALFGRYFAKYGAA